MSEDWKMRSPQDFRHKAVVQMENVGSKKAADGINGLRASGLDCMYLIVVSGRDELARRQTYGVSA